MLHAAGDVVFILFLLKNRKIIEESFDKQLLFTLRDRKGQLREGGAREEKGQRPNLRTEDAQEILHPEEETD